MLSGFSCVRLFVTLWTVAYQAPLSMGFSGKGYQSVTTVCYWLLLRPPGDLPNPGTEPLSLKVSCTGSQVLHHQHRLRSTEGRMAATEITGAGDLDWSPRCASDFVTLGQSTPFSES